MHPSSFENMQKCYDRYLAARQVEPDRRWVVVEIGSADINGSYRAIFPSRTFHYVGCDCASGPGVDLVLDDPYRLPLQNAYADVVISGQMLEHCEFFWLAFGEMLRILKPGGLPLPDCTLIRPDSRSSGRPLPLLSRRLSRTGQAFGLPAH